MRGGSQEIGDHRIDQVFPAYAVLLEAIVNGQSIFLSCDLDRSRSGDATPCCGFLGDQKLL